MQLWLDFYADGTRLNTPLYTKTKLVDLPLGRRDSQQYSETDECRMYETYACVIYEAHEWRGCRTQLFLRPA